jgi:hypothetical protein
LPDWQFDFTASFSLKNSFMKKMILLAGIFCLGSIASHVCAQSMNNRNWKAYFADPINDTLTLHVHSDSSFVTTGKGDVMLRTNCMINHDTLTLSDYGDSEHSCPDAKGKYKINLNGKSLTLSLIDDPCDGRAHAIDGVKWVEAGKL